MSPMDSDKIHMGTTQDYYVLYWTNPISNSQENSGHLHLFRQNHLSKKHKKWEAVLESKDELVCNGS